MIKAIAIDDEPLALEIIQSYCNDFKGIILVNTFTNLNNAKKYLNKFDVNLLFIDIEMPGKSGIEFVNTIDKNIKVIFTTAHSKYAVEGFKLNATDYLLKPIPFKRFVDAINKVQKQLELESNNEKQNTHLTIRANYKLYNIELDKIKFIEAMDDYVKIYTDLKNPIVARITMKSILFKLPDSQFIRVHKSYIVSFSNIKTIQNQTIKINDILIPIGKTYKKNVKKYF